MLSPTDGRLLIEELPDEDRGGLVLVTLGDKSKQAKPWRVVAVGPNVVFPHGAKTGVDFRPGDRVWVDLSMAYELVHERRKYRVVEFPYVIAQERTDGA